MATNTYLPYAATIEPFDGGDFKDYRERVEFFFCANSIGVVASNASSGEKRAAEKKMTAHLISLLSKTVYSTLKSLILPDEIASKKYDELCAVLEKYYKKNTTPTTAAFQFRQVSQAPGETTVDFANKLKRAAVDCQFGSHRDRALTDQFISGMASSTIRRKLLLSKESDIDTFEKVIDLASKEELAISYSKQFTAPSAASASIGSPTDIPVHMTKERRSTKQPMASGKRCFRCGSDMHLANKCRHKDAECRYCHKRGHLEKVCRTKLQRDKRDCHHVMGEDLSTSDSDCEDAGESVPMYTVRDTTGSVPPFAVDVVINEVPIPIRMEVDTGSGVSILNKRDFEKLGGVLSTLPKSTVLLRGFSDKPITCLGELEMNVTLNGTTAPVKLRVVDVSGPSLLGRDMLQLFQLPWNEIFSVKTRIDETVAQIQLREEIMAQFPDLFDSTSMGKLNTMKVNLRVDDAHPVFLKPRKVPFAITEKYDEALDQLERDGILEKVEYSQWATPTVPVKKPDGSIRICADYSRTLNAHSPLESYPLPTIAEIRAKLSGGTKFTKIDLKQAYHQLELDESCRKYTTINTHRGLFEYVRLPFGVHSAVAIFQRTMETVLAGIDGCIVYIDDIVVTGKTPDEHRATLVKVLQRLQEVGMKLKLEKFEVMLDSISYLGHTFSAEGVSPSAERTTAMKDAKPPTTVSELQSFIGSANYVRAFIPNFATIMAPLYALLKKDAVWKWESSESNAFDAIRCALCATETLAFYSTTKDIKVQVDASGVGLGAVLLQEERPGHFRPIAYASRVLTKAEKNYSNIEREALAVVFGATTFRQYLLGRKFIFETDHQPLVKLLGCTDGVPYLVSPRLKKWKLALAAYDYSIKHIPGRQNPFADFMSRQPGPGAPCSDEVADEQVLFIESEVINADTVATETQRDPILKTVWHHVLNGWPETIDQTLQPYFAKRWELSVSDNILLWNDRVIVPESLREFLLNDLHYEHTGVVRMKRLARRYMWWPRIDRDLEQVCAQCPECQAEARLPAKEFGSWSWPTGPWQRLHIDYAGPFMGKMFLVIVDSYSRFLDIVPMDRATSATTIAALRRVFALFGLPHHIVSDNGSQFTSEEFQSFLHKNGIRHTCSAPGHPATNGLAERYVGVFKSKLKAMGTQGDLHATLQRFLLSHRTTPSANNKSPAEMLMMRQPRTRFDTLKQTAKPSVDAYERNMNKTPEFQPGDAVFTLNFGSYGSKWVPGRIVSVISPVNYQVQVQDALWKRHRNQLRARSVPLSEFVREDVAEAPPKSTHQAPSSSADTGPSVSSTGTVSSSSPTTAEKQRI